MILYDRHKVFHLMKKHMDLLPECVIRRILCGYISQFRSRLALTQSNWMPYLHASDYVPNILSINELAAGIDYDMVRRDIGYHSNRKYPMASLFDRLGRQCVIATERKPSYILNIKRMLFRLTCKIHELGQRHRAIISIHDRSCVKGHAQFLKDIKECANENKRITKVVVGMIARLTTHVLGIACVGTKIQSVGEHSIRIRAEQQMDMGTAEGKHATIYIDAFRAGYFGCGPQ